ncbi:putative protein disulfide-isomerase Erp38p [[Candida] railenensis]|uniref:protein disulfide-isomerase n=1 Tax=[Candida] railenensis TaxID=45579 RepID=A0A9P0QPK3_9ASCO|nr:putative protein disulfide-isomerase Erp38p [[Candida] railenensis]
MKVYSVIISTFLLVAGTLAGFSADSGVIQVNDKNFDDIVVNSDKWSLVDYYADWCRHCQSLHPIYDQLGALFKDEDTVQILRINGDKDGRKTTRKYEVDGFPMVQMYHGKDEPITFEGSRDLQSLSNFVQSVANVRLPVSQGSEDYVSDVVQLNDLNFQEKVFSNTKPTIVAFTASWCGHCVKLSPTWEKLANRVYANDLETSLQIGEVKTTEEPSEKLMEQFGVKGFPTILFFDPLGPPSKEDGLRRPVQYSGDRSLESLIEFINENAGLHRTTTGQLSSNGGTVQKLNTLINEKLHQSEEASLSSAISLLKDIDELVKVSSSSFASQYISKADDLSMVPYYKKLVNKIINGEDEFFKKEHARLTKIVTTNSRNLQEKTVDSMQKRINILKSFIDN